MSEFRDPVVVERSWLRHLATVVTTIKSHVEFGLDRKGTLNNCDMLLNDLSAIYNGSVAPPSNDSGQVEGGKG
jgi:hypothetical protein